MKSETITAIRTSIRHKVFLQVFATSLLLGFLFAAIESYIEYRREWTSIEDHFEEINKAQAESIATALWQFDEMQLSALAKGILNYPYFCRVKITSKDGIELTTGNNSTCGNIENIIPIFYNSGGDRIEIGSLSLKIDTSGIINRVIILTLTRFLSVAGVVIILGITISHLFRRRIISPIIDIAHFLQTASIEKNANQLRINKQKVGDEIDFLVDSFNVMQSKLHSTLSKNEEALLALKESEERFSLATRSSQLAVWDWNVKDNIMVWDDRMFELYGLNRELFPKCIDAWTNGLHPEDKEKAIEECNTALRGEGEFDTEFRVLHPDGKVLWLKANGVVIRDAEKNALRMIGLNQDITELKKTEKELRSVNELFSLFMKHSPIYTFIKEVSADRSIVLQASANYDQMIGMPAHKMIGRSMKELFPSELAASMTSDDWAVVSGGKIVTVEETFNNRTYSTIKFPIVREDRKLLAGFTMDITERKSADDKLRESEERHRRIIEVLNDAILLRSNDIIIYANSAALQLFRAAHFEDLIGKRYLDLIHPDDRAMSAVRVKKILEEDSAASLREHRVLTLDGQVRQVESSGVPFKYRGETQVFGVFRDITERKRAEDMMRNAAHEWSTSFDAMPDGVSIHDSDHTIVRVNHTLCQLLGKDAEELIGKKCYDIFHGTDNPIAACPIELSRKTRKKENIELFDSFLNKWLSVSSSPIFDESGQLKQLVHIIRDITDRKQMEKEKVKLQDQLLQAQKIESVGRLAGGVAHDFNNMLGLILGHAELALEKVDPTHPLAAALKEIMRAAERSSDITRQLLAFARQQPVTPKVLDLNEALGNMLKMLQRLIGENIDLKWQSGANLWQARMDPTQIDQILANLCVNARDAISDTGKITIETGNIVLTDAYCADHAGFVPGEYVKLIVSDDGCGMDRETAEKIFEPFFTTKGIGKGTGLGLSTVYGIVKQNNGFINVYSEPGRGTTFTIYLPRHLGKSEQAEAARPQEPLKRGHETILLVEDEPALLELNKIILEKQGYQVLATGSPTEAIRVAGEHSGKIHLLMTDVVMPEMNGRDLAKQLFALDPDLKCLFASGYTADVIAHHGILDEGIHFIQKPFSRKDLAAKVREVLDRK